MEYVFKHILTKGSLNEIIENGVEKWTFLRIMK